MHVRGTAHLIYDTGIMPEILRSCVSERMQIVALSVLRVETNCWIVKNK